MSKVVLLDAGPLGMVTHPRKNPEIKAWLQQLLRRGVVVMVPEIADYEVRRELLRAGKRKGVARLDALKTAIGYVPLTTETMLKAAEFWAEARRQGQPTADDKALDGDVILAAQVVTMKRRGDDMIVATTNVGHLGRFVEAKNWQAIT
ncbi:MAG TPA: nuclease [Candidatus Binatia bacterium]|nr:nuclease [Candidatus Binatia bacterium]